MADESPAQQDAYALLSTPTLELTEAQIKAVIEDLRKRRFISLSTGKPDKIKQPKNAAVKKTAEEKAAATAALLGQIDWKL